MSESEPQFLDLGPGETAPARRIAYRADPPERDVSLFWLSGYKSDMASTKATELSGFASANGYGCTRFDYSGHGMSSGKFEDGTIGAWLEEAEAVFRRLTLGKQIIVGSSMGGYIALLLLKRLMLVAPEDAARLVGLVLIAPAWDMTEELMWKQFNYSARRELENTGVYRQPSEYGEPYAITRALIEEGRSHLMAKKPFDPGRPVIVLQGRLDTSVPIGHVRTLLGLLKGGWAELIEVPDGEHRLSRPQDLSLLFTKIDELITR